MLTIHTDDISHDAEPTPSLAARARDALTVANAAGVVLGLLAIPIACWAATTACAGLDWLATVIEARR